MREETRPQFCYQVQDFTMPLPKQLEDLHMTCNINHPREALVLAVHVMMTETGFEIEGWQENASDGSTEDHTAKENLCWVKSDSLLKIHYSHPTCPAARFSVAFLFVEPNVIIHGLVMAEDCSEGFSLNLRISDFIQKAFLSDPEPNKVYKNLTTMSRIVKDSVALPLLGWAQSVSNVPATFGFMTLSNEIQLLILGYLNVRDLLAASRVSIDLFSLSSHPVLWRKLFFKNYPSVEISPTENISDWREAKAVSQVSGIGIFQLVLVTEKEAPHAAHNIYFTRYKREHLLRKEQRECALRLLPRMPDPMGLPLRINHRPFVPPPMPLLIDDEFEFDGLLPRPPRFSPPYLPELPRRMPDPALPRPHFSRFGILPHQRFGPGFDFL